MKQQDMDNLVEVIANQVKQRIAQSSQPQVEKKGFNQPPVHNSTSEKVSCIGRADPCYATKDQCEGSGMCAVRKRHVVDAMIQDGASRIGAGLGIVSVDHSIAQMIDHTILKPDVTKEQIENVCKEAITYGFATVCVNSANIPIVARLLRGTKVKPIAVVGFPLGASLSSAKAYEALEAIKNGAQEIDMVINIGALKSKDYNVVLDDIAKVVSASKPYKVKVILETGMLTEDEKVVACALAKSAGAHFVKTSTGFGPGGATVSDIQLMRRIVGNDMEVKASGGIRTKSDATAMKVAGADRIGASASVSIVTGASSAEKSKGY